MEELEFDPTPTIGSSKAELVDMLEKSFILPRSEFIAGELVLRYQIAIKAEIKIIPTNKTAFIFPLKFWFLLEL